MSILHFPSDFTWGVATSAQQIEGGWDADGRGESIWDRFAARPGNIEDGSRPHPACDHYHLWRRDLELMEWLGVSAYRFSTSWSRVMPTGRGRPNAAGLDFYERLVDALLAAGITPFLTLNHWDLPQALEERGGWPARETCAAFVAYADAVATRLGDRVRHWVTHNEPWCVATLGYAEGAHAPGGRDPQQGLRAAHHLLLSHGQAAVALRQRVPAAQVGIVLNVSPGRPATNAEADRAAVRQFDGLFHRWYLDPLVYGRYPADAIADRIRWGHLPAEGLTFVADGDLERMCVPLDFLGINCYSGTLIAAGPDGRPRAVPAAPREELTEMGWEVCPEALTAALERMWRDYDLPALYVTENGAAFADPPPADGRIADPRRVAYLREHLIAAHHAIARGVPLRGYFAWSLLDNFEWGHGYTKRFGLFGVNFTTGARIPKASADWYRDVVTAGAVHDATEP